MNEIKEFINEIVEGNEKKIILILLSVILVFIVIVTMITFKVSTTVKVETPKATASTNWGSGWKSEEVRGSEYKWLKESIEEYPEMKNLIKNSITNGIILKGQMSEIYDLYNKLDEPAQVDYRERMKKELKDFLR